MVPAAGLIRFSELKKVQCKQKDPGNYFVRPLPYD